MRKSRALHLEKLRLISHPSGKMPVTVAEDGIYCPAGSSVVREGTREIAVHFSVGGYAV